MFFESWKVLCQLAPWLLFGVVLSGVMHACLPAGFVQRKFIGAWGVVKAVLFGIPLPLCSCGVIPAGIGLKNQGASTGASLGFLISTPQTGIDSILVSTAFFGWPFAVFKMATAAITGLLGGWAADYFETESPASEPESVVNPNAAELQSDSVPSEKRPGAGGPATIRARFTGVMMHGDEIMRSIWIWLVIGILVSAAIEVYVPREVFQVVGQWGLFPAMVLVLLLATPLYVCATASVPIAAVLVSGGLPPAAALVFLMAGPATNVTTMGAIYGRFGWRTLAIYLVTIVFGSMAFAVVFDWLLTAQVGNHSAHEHDHQSGVSVASASILLAMMGRYLWLDMKRWLGRHRSTDSDSPITRMTIEGMTCGGCVGRLESAILECQGVESVTVELKSGLATIVGAPNEEELTSRIQSLGFDIVDLPPKNA